MRSPTAAQHRRRQHIVDAARVEAAAGYHGITMRAVAESSRASTATIYRYFPSKPHLVMAIFSRWLEGFDRDLDYQRDADSDPGKALVALVTRLHRQLYRTTGLADAVAHAFALADDGAAAEVEGVRAHLSELFAEALGGADFTADDLVICTLLSDVWVANLLGASQRRITPTEFGERLTTTVRLLVTASARYHGPMR